MIKNLATGEETVNMQYVKGCDLCGHVDSDGFEKYSTCSGLSNSNSLQEVTCVRAK